LGAEAQDFEGNRINRKRGSMQQVTTAVLEKDGRILLAKRKKGKYLDNQWELPGGKIDPGETPEQCLKRELKEEFTIEAEVGPLIGTAHFKNQVVDLELLVYEVAYVSGNFKLLEHEAIEWVLPEEIESYDLVDSDRVVIRKLLNFG